MIRRLRSIFTVSSASDLSCLFAAIVLGMGVRLYFAQNVQGFGYDMQTWDIISTLNGADIYLKSDRYAYPPLWAQVLHGLRALQPATGLSLPALVTTLFSTVDLLHAVFLLLMMGPVEHRKGILAASLLLLNPVTFLSTVYWGQFDPVAFFPIVWALALHENQKERPPFLAIWVLGSLALALKHNMPFYVWTLYVCSSKSLVRACLMMAGSVAIVLLSFAPYWHAAGPHIVENVVHRFANHPGTTHFLALPMAGQRPLLFIVLIALPFYAPGPQARSMARCVVVDNRFRFSVLHCVGKLCGAPRRSGVPGGVGGVLDLRRRGGRRVVSKYRTYGPVGPRHALPVSRLCPRGRDGLVGATNPGDDSFFSRPRRLLPRGPIGGGAATTWKGFPNDHAADPTTFCNSSTNVSVGLTPLLVSMISRPVGVSNNRFTRHKPGWRPSTSLNAWKYASLAVDGMVTVKRRINRSRA